MTAESNAAGAADLARERRASFVIFLVHGTFAPFARWTKSDSPLCRHLQDRLRDAVFIRHEWSGSFTQRARRRASDELREKLKESYKSHPGAHHYVIGHSHGGNIALYAIDDEDQHAPLKGIVCINTPFIVAIRRNTQNFVLPFIYMLAAWLGTATVTVAFLIGAAVFSDLTGLTSAYSFDLSPQSGLSVFRSALVLAFFVLLSAGIFYLLSKRIKLDDLFQRRREKAVADIALPVLKRTRMFALWNASDEVYGIFSLLEALASIPFMLMHTAALLTCFLLFFALTWFGIDPDPDLPVQPFIDAWNPPEGAVRSVVTFVAGIQSAAYSGFSATAGLLWGMIFLALFFNVCLRLVPIGLSWRQAFDSLFVRLSLALTPLTVSHTEFRDVALPYRWLSHSSAHSDPATLGLIADWIASTSRSMR
jgi:hypothetical protein